MIESRFPSAHLGIRLDSDRLALCSARCSHGSMITLSLPNLFREESTQGFLNLPVTETASVSDIQNWGCRPLQLSAQGCLK